MEENIFTKAEEAAAVIRDLIAVTPRVAIVLGSGLGSFAERVEHPVAIAYTAIPHFRHATVEGHSGRLVVGTVAVTVLVLGPLGAGAAFIFMPAAENDGIWEKRRLDKKSSGALWPVQLVGTKGYHVSVELMNVLERLLAKTLRRVGMKQNAPLAAQRFDRFPLPALGEITRGIIGMDDHDGPSARGHAPAQRLQVQVPAVIVEELVGNQPHIVQAG